MSYNDKDIILALLHAIQERSDLLVNKEHTKSAIDALKSIVIELFPTENTNNGNSSKHKLDVNLLFEPDFKKINIAGDGDCGVHTLLRGLQENMSDENIKSILDQNMDHLNETADELHIIKNDPLAYSEKNVKQFRKALANYATKTGKKHTHNIKSKGVWLSEDDLYVAALMFNLPIVILTDIKINHIHFYEKRVIDPSVSKNSSGFDPSGNRIPLDTSNKPIYILNSSKQNNIDNHWELLIPHKINVV